jgi:hypothetical protein
MKNLTALLLALVLALPAHGQVTMTYSPSGGSSMPVSGSINIKIDLNQAWNWITGLFRVNQLTGPAVDSIVHSLTDVSKINPGTQIQNTINIQGMVQQAIRTAVPNLPVRDIKSFDDLKAAQTAVVPELSKIADEYFTQYLKQAGSSLTDLRDKGQLTMPSFERSVLAIGKPTFLSHGDVLTKVNEILAGKGKPGINLGNTTHCDAMTEVYAQLKRWEVSVFEPYVTDQTRFNQRLANATFEATSQGLRNIRPASMESQQVVTGPSAPTHAEDPSTRNYPRPQNPDLKLIDAKLRSAEASAPQVRWARTAGFMSIRAADIAYSEKNLEAFKFFRDTATTMADIALGFVPIVGSGKDLYEAVVGRSLLTNEELGTDARALALLGVVTAGLAPSAFKAGRYISKIAGNSEVVEKVAARAGKIYDALRTSGLEVAESTPALRRFIKASPDADAAKVINNIKGEILDRADALNLKLGERRLRFAEDVNIKEAEGRVNWLPSHNEGSLAVEATTGKTSSDFVRVFSKQLENQERPYIVHKSTIQGLTAEQVARRLNLIDYVPDRIVDVELTKGARIRISEIAKLTPDNEAGHIQVILLDELKDYMKFTNPRELK